MFQIETLMTLGLGAILAVLLFMFFVRQFFPFMFKLSQRRLHRQTRIEQGAKGIGSASATTGDEGALSLARDEIDRLRIKLADKSTAIGKYRREITHLTALSAKTQLAIDERDGKLAMLGSRLKQMETDLAARLKSATKLKERFIELEKQGKELHQNLVGKQEELEQKRTLLARQEELLVEKSVQIEEYAARQESDRETIAQLKATLGEVEASNKRINGEKEALMRAKSVSESDVSRQLQDALKQRDDLAGQNSALSQDRARAEEELAGLRIKAQCAEKTADQAIDEKRNLENEIELEKDKTRQFREKAEALANHYVALEKRQQQTALALADARSTISRLQADNEKLRVRESALPEVVTEATIASQSTDMDSLAQRIRRLTGNLQRSNELH